MQRAQRSGVANGSAFALGLLLIGCPGPSHDKTEAAAVSRAVSALRAADNQGKSELLGALRSAPCSVEDVCAVRSACIAAYELQTTTLTRSRQIAAAPADDQAKASAALDELKSDFARAALLGAKCTDLEGQMIRRYKL